LLTNLKHNIRKVKTTEDKQRERLERSKERAKDYLVLREQFLAAVLFNILLISSINLKKQNGEANMDILKLLTSLLNMAGDCYTYWNYRKKVILVLEEYEFVFSVMY
jgi:hypothetical protein